MDGFANTANTQIRFLIFITFPIFMFALNKVKYNNKEIPGIRFLPVYLQSFNATYNSATGGMHNDGRFTSIDISLAFTETRAIAKADVKEGF